ncbi:hypothetical protein ACFUIZ_19140 [Streptomyces cinereoruber]|uniref:hypothetical protein n=1 Tax=Streptomyces cinereoruber TaxID=67260 RepID=UPI0036375DA2
MAASRRFRLQRHTDVTGVSGTGVVADGVLWPDGTASIRWRGDRPSAVFWDDIAHAEAVHGHGGATEIVWDDPEPAAPDTACPHCPDGHTPPDRGSQPWSAFVGPERDGDGQPITIHVGRAGGAHVAESDAQWIRNRLNS